VGRNHADLIDESSAAEPVTTYEATKLAVDETLRLETRGTELVIVRPTAVFGPGGQNLLKLARETAEHTMVPRYLRACLQGFRRMNLVSVEAVCAALSHVATLRGSHEYEVFIVSDDDAPTNNYHDVERVLRGAFARRDYPWPVLALPPMVEIVLRRLAGRSSTNAQRRFVAEKLAATGFRKPVTFDVALQRYAEYLASQFRADGIVSG
jgi:nucleoside-diphosphate-sugar epimerase